MSSLHQFIKLIVVFIPILTLANGNLITLDGQCELSQLKPSEVGTAEILNGTYYVLAQTFMGPTNRSNIQMMLNPEEKNVNITEVFRCTENDECNKLYINMEATNQKGVYDVLYQIAPNSDFVKFKGYILGQDLYFSNHGGYSNVGTLSFVLYLCRDLPDSKHQVEISYLSLHSKMVPCTEKTMELMLSYGFINDLYKYLEKIDQTHRCDSS